jgi:hypothetical protein
MTAIRKQLSYANVMATLAVFIALGGGAFAALRVPANSVGTKQLKRGAVTAIKVKAASLTGEDFKPHSLSSADLPLLGLASLQGASGTATNNAAIELKEGACDRYVFAASGAQPGEAVILQGSDISELQHAIEGGPSISNPNQINVSVCAGAQYPVNQAPGTVQLRFDTIG